MTILDMTNLRDIIDNDKDLEAELIENFNLCYADNIKALEESLMTQDDIQWRNAAHTLKGIAYNLGAEELSAISLKAEQAAQDAVIIKKMLLADIKHAYDAVAAALKQQ